MADGEYNEHEKMSATKYGEQTEMKRDGLEKLCRAVQHNSS